MDDFTYSPMDRTQDSLRLIILKGGTGPEIYCELDQRTFASKPKYEALSYTWGDQPPSQKIFVHGRHFHVRENLFNALWHLRHSTEERTIWVDAISINQSDVEERNHQVSLMTFIFARAQRVLVWLGLRPYSMEIVDLPSALRGIVLDSSEKNHEFETQSVLGERNSRAIALHPYWKRIWVVQEVVLAREVRFYFGERNYSWEELSVSYNKLSPEIKKAAHPIMQKREQRYTDGLLLEALIETFQDSLCAEPRDKIFGLLGMAHDGSRIKVDYAGSYLSLYADMIKFHQSRPPVDKLGLEPAIERAARLMKFSQLAQKVLGGMVGREAENTSLSQELGREMPSYSARGVVAGEIIHIGPTYTEMISSSKANIQWKQALEEHYQSKSSVLISLRENDEAYSHIALNWDEQHLSRIRNINTGSSFGYRGYRENPFERPDRLVRRRSGSYVQSEPRRFLGTCGLTGFIPDEAKVGDLICWFWGCDVAVILRGPVDTNIWTIVGRADVSTAVPVGIYEQRQNMFAFNCLSYSESEEEELGTMDIWLTLDILQELTY